MADSAAEASWHHGLAAAAPPPEPPDRGVLQGFAHATASCFYAFEGVALVLPVANELTPSAAAAYPRVLTTTLCAVALTFALLG